MADEDSQFDDLLAGFDDDDQQQEQQQEEQQNDLNQEEEEIATSQQNQHNHGKYDDDDIQDGDWDAIMQAAEEAEDVDMNGAAASSETIPTVATQSFSSQAKTPHIPSSSFTAPTPGRTGAPATKPRTFADCFSTQTFEQPAAAAASAKSAPPTRPSYTSSSSPASSTPTASRTASRGVEFGSAPAPAASTPTVQYLPKETNDELRDPISGFKITNRLISSVTLKEKLAGSAQLSLVELTKRRTASTNTRRATAQSAGSLASLLGTSSASSSSAAPSGGAFGILGNWVLFGVISHRSLPKTTSTGKGKFVVWTLSDLNGISATLLLFGKAFEAYWQQMEGTVVALANPEDSSTFVGKGGGGGGGSASGGSNLCLSIRHSGQLLSLGTCADFAYCRSFRNEPMSHGKVKGFIKCKNVVNLSKSEYCEYHVKEEYKKLIAKRPDINGGREVRAINQIGAPGHQNVPTLQIQKKSMTNVEGKMYAKNVFDRNGNVVKKNQVNKPTATGKPNQPLPLSTVMIQNQGRVGVVPNNHSIDGRTLLATRDIPKSAESKEKEEKKWNALSSQTTMRNSTFVQRFVGASTGQNSSLLATKEIGLLAKVEQMKKKENEKVIGATLSSSSTLVGSKKIQSNPSESSSNASKPTVPISSSNPVSRTAATSSSHRPSTLATNPSVSRSAHASGSSMLSVLNKEHQLTHQQRTPSSSTKPTAPTSTPSPAAISSSTTPASAATVTPASHSFTQSFGAVSTSSSTGAGLVPMLGRGWIQTPAQAGRPAVLNASERARLARLEQQTAQVAALRAAGVLNRPDPNSTMNVNMKVAAVTGVKRKSMDDDPAKRVKTNYVLQENGSVTMVNASAAAAASSSSTSSTQPAPPSEEELRTQAKRARLAAAFGQVTHDTAGIDRILSATSSHSNLVQESESSRLANEAFYNILEKKEALAIHVGSITQQAVKIYKCTHPGCTQPPSEFPMRVCLDKKHRLEKVESIKRFFSCQGCKFHLTTVSAKLPTHACHKCGSKIWLKTAMIPMKIDSSDRGALQLRSEETELRGIGATFT